jgi:hypothetical protein
MIVVTQRCVKVLLAQRGYWPAERSEVMTAPPATD